MAHTDSVLESLEVLIQAIKEHNSKSIDDVSKRNQIMTIALDRLIALFEGDCDDLIKSNNKEYKCIGYTNKGYVRAAYSIQKYDEALECFDNAIKYCDDDEKLGKLLLDKKRVTESMKTI